MFHKLLLLLAFSVLNSVCSQDSLSYYLVYFKDKQGSEFKTGEAGKFLSSRSLERRAKRNISIDETDLPVSVKYLKLISNLNPDIRLINSSRWLNAALVSCTEPSLASVLLKNDFVIKTEYLGRLKQRSIPEKELIDSEYFAKSRELQNLKSTKSAISDPEKLYNKSYLQNEIIGIPALHAKCTNMQSVMIAVFDAGFRNAYKIKGMEDLLDKNVLIRDFVDYDNSVWEDDQHGCNVLGFMKTYNPGFYVGSAPLAQYALMRTEIGYGELPLEEVNWLLAAECADSLGVDLIAASIGYHTFDDPALNHKHSDLNGKTSIVARAAGFAYARGIMVISSAGNEGNNKWHKIGTPADAAAVIAIGACDDKGFHSSFSSYGPSADGRIKPDFIAPGHRVSVASVHGQYAGNGTSYATPIFAGAMASLISLFPEHSYNTIKEALLLSATHRNLADTAYGFGVPDFALAACILGNCDSSYLNSDIFYLKNQAILFQDLNIHFKSNSAQSVKIKITTVKGKKTKTVYRKNIVLKKGEWLHSDVLMRLHGGLKKRKKKKQGYDNLLLTIETENGTYQRRFSFK